MHLRSNGYKSVNAGVTLSRSWLPMDTWIGAFGSFFGNFVACQRFPEVSWSWSRCSRKTTRVCTMAYSALMNGPMFSWCFYVHFWFAKFPYSYVHQGSISGQCDTSINNDAADEYLLDINMIKLICLHLQGCVMSAKKALTGSWRSKGRATHALLW